MKALSYICIYLAGALTAIAIISSINDEHTETIETRSKTEIETESEIESSTVEEESTEIESESIEIQTENSNIEFDIPEIPDDCIGYVYIPSCNVSAFIRYGSTMEAISNKHVGEFEVSGEIGVDNYCILGHARKNRDDLVFSSLEPNISVGDTIYIVKDNYLYTFKAGHYRIVEPEDVWIVNKTGYPCITIMCCTNYGKQRFVVFGNLVDKMQLDKE